MKTLEPFFIGYMACWIIISLVAIATYLRKPEAFSISSPGYRQFILVPWKLVTFVIATFSLTIIAPYTGDPTWDYFDSIFMSVFAFLGAPWVVGVLYLFARKKETATTLFVALCIWMFSTSWSYDLYIVLKDGHYPATWFANIFASAVLYISAGLMWNLDWRKNRGMTFSFLESDWPFVATETKFSKIFWFAFPFMLLVAASMLYFVLPALMNKA
jgi:hypothetical protein